MKKNLLWKVITILLVLVACVAGILLGQDWAESYSLLTTQGIAAAIGHNIHLGLDLKGGTHLILQVQVADAINADTDQTVERLKTDLKTANVAYGEVMKPDPAAAPEKIVVKGVPSDKIGDLRSLVSSKYGEYDMSSSVGDTYTITMKPSILKGLKDKAVTQAIETIRNRIDALGVSEPVIQEHGLGEYQILVQLPGVDDPARVKDIMQSTAMLEIRQTLENGRAFASMEEATTALGMRSDAVVMKGSNIHRRTSDSSEQQDSYYIVSRVAAVSGRDLRSADAQRDENGQPSVGFTLTNEGGKKFEQFTSAHIGDYLAVVLDGHVREVAVIKGSIRDRGQISGNMDDQQAQDLSMILRSGALPASIKYLEERTVGPSLGLDSIRQGVRAAIIGMLAVMIFMLIYYKGAGINADLALVFNLLILLAFLAYFKATLTLPGIAGLILTVGMGVDSNVLIFERIREELRAGKTPPSAVEQGFGHAWLTIIDTHVTTIVSAAILFMFGTGPVKGFAVTLTFGLLANLFTAVFVSRVIFDSNLNRHQRGEALSI